MQKRYQISKVGTHDATSRRDYSPIVCADLKTSQQLVLFLPVRVLATRLHDRSATNLLRLAIVNLEREDGQYWPVSVYWPVF